MKWLRRKTQKEPAHSAGRAVTEREITAAYELLFKRQADETGLEHYRARARDGLTLQELIDSLLQSDEYRALAAKGPTDEGERPQSGPNHDAALAKSEELIHPADVVRRYSLEELKETADEYYRRVSDPTPLMAKPFAFLHETPEMLRNLGVLLGHLHLGKTMTVLDFGGGTGWLSRILIQLHCRAICCDVSSAALEIGRRLFDEYPVIGNAIADPVFLVFDGHRINLPDESVDRVICFDAFHHIPNPATVLHEFGRVLKAGGIAGFSEPGPQHSRSPQAQYEMKNHRVLENDINLESIFGMAKGAGFTAINIHVGAEAIVDLRTYAALIERDSETAQRVAALNILDAAATQSIFWLNKGSLQLDSRSHVGLAHRFSTDRSEYFVSRDADSVKVSCTITNTGAARWLNDNTEIFGIVRVGAHLYDAAGELREIDYYRSDLPRPVEPGEMIDLVVDVPIPDEETCRLALDLVAEGVTWFENVGSSPVYVTARRT